MSGEVYYPLKVFVCEQCFLVQLDEFKKSTEIFSEDYVYFSSVSTSWLDHSKKYVHKMREKLPLTSDSFVIEIASNDGYLLQYVNECGIKCLGIEPTHSTAKAAREKGIDVLESFFGTALAMELKETGRQADLLLGNNVLAHVPDINDFVEGLKIALKPTGTVTMEFPHLLKLVADGQFDTIYHEHFSYLSFSVVSKIFSAHGLTMYDVEEIPTHGGSLRIFGKHVANESIAVSDAVVRLLEQERSAGVLTQKYYEGFQSRMEVIKNDFVEFLLSQKRQGKKVAAYGAAAKGNTLLNFSGIRGDLIEFVADRAESKQGKWLPGSRIPVVSESHLQECRPDYVVLFPWNIRTELEKQLVYIRDWGGKFVTAVPKLEVF
jgi:SAM-dependent methyltransferase